MIFETALDVVMKSEIVTLLQRVGTCSVFSVLFIYLFVLHLPAPFSVTQTM
jgi:ABC-type microcin C transport system duplicated ATPase subunit YejF